MRSHAVVLGALALVASAAPAPEPIKTVTNIVDVAYTVWVDQAGHTVTVNTEQVEVKGTRFDVKPEPTNIPTYTSVVPANPTPEPQPAPAPAPAPEPAPEPARQEPAQKAQQPAPQPAPEPAQQPQSYAPATPNAGSYPNSHNGAGYAKAVLDVHNAYRSNHQANPLSWDADMAEWAYKTASSCKWGHDTSLGGSKGYGQNIQAGTPANKINDVIYSWYSEEKDFAPYYGTNGNSGKFSSYGHFTQVVWTDTTAVGCASFDCSGRGLSGVGGSVSPTFTVCNYYPPGNFGGEYASKVKRPVKVALGPISISL